MSQALYRKYRPKTFAEVVSQDHVVSTLQNEIAAKNFAHAYMFSGPRGTGKTSIARLLAKAINADSIKKHSQANIKYYELGINFYELSQKAKQIYLKADDEQKRQLISLVLDKLILNEGKLTYGYKKAFQIICDMAQVVGSSKMEKEGKTSKDIFEPKEKVDTTSKTPHFAFAHPVLLPRLDSNQ